MTDRRVSVARALVEQVPSLTSDELDSISSLAVAIHYAIEGAEQLCSTLNPRARALVITKLEEANHWCLELTRTPGK